MFSKTFSDKKAQNIITVKQEIRIVLIGKTGVGKSATGNSFVGNEVFKSEGYGSSVTKKCKSAEVIRDDKKVVIVDTPGLFDYEQPVDRTKIEVAKCIAFSSPGVHCFLLVVQAGRFTEEDKQTFKQIRQMFGENFHRYAIVLFTKVDHLKGKDSDEGKFRNFLDNLPLKLQETIQKVDQRCIWINNRADEEKKEAQVSRLLKMIQETVTKNRGSCYTKQMYDKIDRNICEKFERFETEEHRQHQMIEKENNQQKEELRRKKRDDIQKAKNVAVKKAQKVFTIDDEIRIVLVGKTGVGKSETGNSIIGKDVFESEDFPYSVTQKCKMAEAIRDGKKIVVVDTPGLFDHKQNVENTTNEVTKCIGILAPGVHCFLLIIQTGRFSEEDKQEYEHILQMFGENVLRFGIVLITKVDQLKGKESDEEKFRKFEDYFPSKLHELLQKVDHRCIWINNRADEKERENQVSKLLKMIQETVTKNGGECYTNAMYQEIDRKIREKIERIRLENDKKI